MHQALDPSIYAHSDKNPHSSDPMEHCSFKFLINVHFDVAKLQYCPVPQILDDDSYWPDTFAHDAPMFGSTALQTPD